jgi:hypothetical protein
MVRQILPNNNESATGIFLQKISDLNKALVEIFVLATALFVLLSVLTTV